MIPPSDNAQNFASGLYEGSERSNVGTRNASETRATRRFPRNWNMSEKAMYIQRGSRSNARGPSQNIGRSSGEVEKFRRRRLASWSSTSADPDPDPDPLDDATLELVDRRIEPGGPPSEAEKGGRGDIAEGAAASGASSGGRFDGCFCVGTRLGGLGGEAG